MLTWTSQTWSEVIKLVFCVLVGAGGITLMITGSGVMSKAVGSTPGTVKRLRELTDEQATLVAEAAALPADSPNAEEVKKAAESKGEEIKGLLTEIAKLPPGDRLVIWGFAAVILAAVIAGWLKISLGI